VANNLSISFQNDMQELTHVLQVVNVFLEPRELQSKLVYAVNLILEEILVNIIKYGYDDEDSHEIEVKIGVEEEVALTVIDDGKEFTPSLSPRQIIPNPLWNVLKKVWGCNSSGT